MKKDAKNERISIRVTSSQKKKLEAEASKLDMKLSSYCADKLTNGRLRVSYAKRKTCTILVNTGRYLDEIAELIDAEPSDYISKQLLLQPLSNAREEIAKIWKY